MLILAVPLAFATDSEIAKIASPGAQRELKPWTPDADAAHPATNGRANGGAGRDSETFGGGANIPWDQFETNARLFGTTTSYKEEIYTTKLDRSGPGYKQREKEAAKLANEILGVSYTLFTGRYFTDIRIANFCKPACCRRTESSWRAECPRGGGKVSLLSLLLRLACQSGS